MCEKQLRTKEKKSILLSSQIWLFIVMAIGKRKGLSFEEKRDRLLKIYYRLREPLNLKEIEKLGPKAGVIPQAVKEVN